MTVPFKCTHQTSEPPELSAGWLVKGCVAFCMSAIERKHSAPLVTTVIMQLQVSPGASRAAKLMHGNHIKSNLIQFMAHA